MTEVLDLLLKAPDSQISKPIVEIIDKWSKPPKEKEISDTLEEIFYSGGASSFAIGVLKLLLRKAQEK